MGVNNNWRPVHSMDDWMRDIEKRLMHEERRPSYPHPSDVVGPGFRPYALLVEDWNSDGPIIGGHFYSTANQVVNSPDDTKNWMGIVQSNQFGRGLQRVWEYIDTAEDPSPDPAVFTRAFHTHEDGGRDYTLWIQGGGGGGTDLAVDDEGTEVAPQVFRLNFVGDGVTASPSGAASEIDVLIPGAGSGVTGTLDAYTAVCVAEMNPLTTFPTGGNVPGCNISVAVGGPDENFLVVAAADLGWISGSSTAVCWLSVDGTDWLEPGGQLSEIVVNTSDAQRVTAHQNWLVHGLTEGNHTFLLKARQAGSGSGLLRQTHTGFTVVRLVGAIGPQGPPGGLTGTAGGDLTGTYPNPEIGPGKVTSTEVAANAIYQAHIVDGEVTWSKMAASTKDQAQTLASMRTLGTGAAQAAAGDHAHAGLYVPVTRTISTQPPLTGGGALSANVALGLDTFTATVKGAVPPPTTATGKFLKDDGTWAVPGSGTVNKFATDVGGATSVAVNHNLSTRDVTVDVYRNSTPWDSVECDVERTSTSQVTLRFAVAPAAAAYRCVVIA